MTTSILKSIELLGRGLSQKLELKNTQRKSEDVYKNYKFYLVQLKGDILQKDILQYIAERECKKTGGLKLDKKICNKHQNFFQNDNH